MPVKSPMPHVIADFIDAQNRHDAAAVAATFTEKGVVHDEGKDYSGKEEITEWVTDTSAKYNPRIEAKNFDTKEKVNVLTAQVSGSFDGSPVMLYYHFEITDNLVTSLKITDQE